MNYDEFVGQVQQRARLPSKGGAVGAIRATLETLAERLAGGEAKDLAAQLPREISIYLEQKKPSESFGLDEFFRRVSECEGVDLPASVFHTRVVVEVLREAVSPGEMADVRAQLPAEFNPLFESGSQGSLNPLKIGRNLKRNGSPTASSKTKPANRKINNRRSSFCPPSLLRMTCRSCFRTLHISP